MEKFQVDIYLCHFAHGSRPPFRSTSLIGRVALDAQRNFHISHILSPLSKEIISTAVTNILGAGLKEFRTTKWPEENDGNHELSYLIIRPDDPGYRLAFRDALRDALKSVSLPIQSALVVTNEEATVGPNGIEPRKDGNNNPLDDDFIKQTAFTDRSSLQLAVQWDPEELYQILRRANKLNIHDLHNLLKYVGVDFKEETIRESYLGALDEADSKEKIFEFLEKHGV